MKEIFLERLLRILNQEYKKCSGLELAIEDLCKYLLRVFIRLIKEGNKPNG